MLTQLIGRALGWACDEIVRALARTSIQPNLLTALGLLTNLWAAASVAAGNFAAGGGLMILAGGFDLVDGPVARAQGRVTRFGEFFHSTMGCYSDLVLFLGLLVYYARVNRFFYAVLVCVAMAGSVMVSYVRARAQSLIPDARMGFWERPERLVLMIVGAVSYRMAPALWLLAIGPNLDVVQRILYARERIREALPQPAPARRGGLRPSSAGLTPSSPQGD